MKITCQSCQAKYTIADEKVAGKTVKIKCKKCGATIVVNGSETGGVAPLASPVAAPPAVAAAPPGDEDEGDGATRVFAEGGPGSEWTVNVTDEDQRTLTSAQLVIEYRRGVVNDDTYVWKDGMADWSPVSNVPELTTLIGAVAAPAAGPAYAPAPQPAAGEPPGGLGGTMIMNEGATPTPLAAASHQVAAATPAPAAARRKAPAGGVDLFAPGQQPDGGGLSAASSSATTSADRLVGERNENSVLFSISALTAAAGASKRGDDPFDLGPSPAGRNGGRNSGGASVDDIMNLGGGMSQGPVLAPPPLLAPVVEMPPPPPVMAMQQPMGGGMQGMGMGQEYPQKKKAPIGLIIGIVVGVFGLGGGAFFALNSGGGGKTVAEGTTTATTATTAAPEATTAAPTPTQAPAADTATAVPVSTGAPTPSADPKTAAAGNPGRNDPRPNPGTGKAPDPKPEPKADPKPEPKADPKPEPKADPKPDPGGGGKEFDRGAASSTLGGAAGAAKSCKTADGPTGSGRVKVTFAPSGNATSVTLESGPFAGTPLAGCIIGAFRGAHVPAFDGAPVSVGKSFNIN